jgi:hypothetical protein
LYSLFRNVTFINCVQNVPKIRPSMLSTYVDKILEIFDADFDVIDQLLLRFSAFFIYGEKVGVQWSTSCL